MILLYTAVNVSLAVWLLKGFIDEIPREYEEAAMIDGYTRLQAFVKVVLPQATTGIAATAIFCLIFAWNEYAFAVLLTSGDAQTMPPFIPIIIGEGGQDWPAVAAGDDAVPGPDRRLHRPAAQASAARHHLRSGAQMSATIRRLPRAASRWLRARPAGRPSRPCAHRAGVVMLMQPFSLTSTPSRSSTIAGGTAMFIVVSQFPGVSAHGRDPRREPAQVLRRLRRRAGLELHGRATATFFCLLGPVGLRQDDDACA